MFRRDFDDIWKKVAKVKGYCEPDPFTLDFYWACLGVLGRFSCPKKFEQVMMMDEGFMADTLVFEVKSKLN